MVGGSTEGPTQTPRDAYEVDFDSLALEQELGKGAFGRVVKARLSSSPYWLRGTTMPMTVAVKMLKGKLSTSTSISLDVDADECVYTIVLCQV